jgi:uncharacterized protein (TIGR00369 family)
MNEHLRCATPAGGLLGRELLEVDASTGEVRMAFVARDDFANRHGTVHGGLLAAMLDSAAANAVLATLAPGTVALTRRLDTRFHRPAPLGPLRSASRIVTRDERGATVDAELFDADGMLVASARAELRLKPRLA